VIEVEADAVHGQIQRLLSSKTFESSEGQRRLLQYLAEKALSGEADHLKEYTVGLEAFGKPDSYDPQADSIVRTQTGRLRGKLLEYYATEGKDDAIIVELPKGGFKLVSRIEEPAPAPAIPQAPAEPSRNDSSGKILRLLIPVIPWLLCIIFAAAWVDLKYQISALRTGERVSPVAVVPWPLSRIVNGRRTAVIVGEDANLPKLRMILGRPLQLDEYLSKGFPNAFLPHGATPRETQVLDLLATGTPVGSATVQNVRTIMAIAGPYASQIAVRSPLEIEARDLRDGNYILIGSSISNPWTSVFEHFLNFREVDETLQHGYKYFTNTHPQKGEMPRYQGISAGDRNGLAYASIALVPNEQRNGNLLLLQGLQKEGTEAAGMLLADPQFCQKLRDALQRLKADPDQAWFEALIRTRAVDGIPRDIELIAVRMIQ
jgi:hypothetical protein